MYTGHLLILLWSYSSAKYDPSQFNSVINDKYGGAVPSRSRNLHYPLKFHFENQLGTNKSQYTEALISKQKSTLSYHRKKNCYYFPSFPYPFTYYILITFSSLTPLYLKLNTLPPLLRI